MFRYCRKFAQSVLFLLTLVFLGCSNVLITHQTNGVEVQLSLPESSGRSVESTPRVVKAWVENTRLERLATEQKTITTNSTTLSFNSIQTGTRARVVILIYDDSGLLYSGNSDYFTTSESGNKVHIRLYQWHSTGRRHWKYD